MKFKRSLLKGPIEKRDNGSKISLISSLQVKTKSKCRFPSGKFSNDFKSAKSRRRKIIVFFSTLVVFYASYFYQKIRSHNRAFDYISRMDNKSNKSFVEDSLLLHL